MKKLLALLLLLSLLVSVAACGKDGEGDDGSGDDTTVSTTEGDSNSYYKENFGDLDFNGKEIWIYDLNTSPDSHVNHYHEANGDEINVALYNRDLMFEELYGVKFEYFNNLAGANVITKAVLGGSYVADIIYGRASGDRLMTLAQSECLLDLRSFESLSFDEPWWSGFMSESLTVNGRLYFTSGDILPTFYQSIGCFFFNIDLGNQYDINKDELSSLVLNGGWTWESLKTLSANANVNLDTNIEMTADVDQFGFISYNVYNHTNMFAIGAGLKLCEPGDGGEWTIDLTSPLSIEKLGKLETYIDNYSMGSNGVDSIMGTTFKSGRAVFAEHFVESAFNSLRDMDNDYLMLPVPKLDEDQSDYYCMVNSYVNCFVGIVSNCADSELTSAILESMAYAGYNDIRPVVYERALKGRLARDPAATDLVDLIFDSAYIDYGVIEKFGVSDDYPQGVSTVLYNYLKEGKPLVSEFDSIKTQAISELENTLNVFMK